jgi:hypothetical protein
MGTSLQSLFVLHGPFIMPTVRLNSCTDSSIPSNVEVSGPKTHDDARVNTLSVKIRKKNIRPITFLIPTFL